MGFLPVILMGDNHCMSVKLQPDMQPNQTNVKKVEKWSLTKKRSSGKSEVWLYARIARAVQKEKEFSLSIGRLFPFVYFHLSICLFPLFVVLRVPR